MPDYTFTLKKDTPQRIYQIIQQLRKNDGPKFEKKMHLTNSMEILFASENTQENYLEIYSYIQEWTIKKYEVPAVLRRNPQILKILSGIEFHNLLYLKIVYMKIDNIQPLIWMDCPQLKQLQLRHNHLVSFKPLLKAYFPKLKRLDLDYNPGTMSVMSPQLDQLGRVYNFGVRNNKYYQLSNRK